MSARARFDESAAESFVWGVLGPSIEVLINVSVVRQDAMDPEALHQFRVALRRLRSDLRSLRPLLNREHVDALRRQLAELDELVRPVRDGDVMVERLTTTASQVPNPLDADSVEAIHQHLSDVTEVARHQLSEALESDRYNALFMELAGIRESELLGKPMPEDLAEVVDHLNLELWRKLRRKSKGLHADADDAQLHRVRVLAKRCRYLAEASEAQLGKTARRRARDAARMQSVLGDHQDSVVFSKMLLEVRRPTTSMALAIDALLAVETDARLKLRRRWLKSWRRIDRHWR